MQHISHNNFTKAIYLILGLIFMGIGTIGIFVPILPTTIFMIIAAYCFLRSSQKLYNRIINNPHYGKPIKDYIEKNYIPKKTKYIILSSMWTVTCISIFILNPNNILSIIAVSMAAIGSLVVIKAKH